MLLMWVLTVFTDTDSSSAICGRDRLVGRYRSTRSSHGLSSSASGGADWFLVAGDSPRNTDAVLAPSLSVPGEAGTA